MTPGSTSSSRPARRSRSWPRGIDWSEGPVWDRKGSFLLFSDVPMNTVYKWKEGMAKPEVFLKPSGYTGTVPRGGEPGSNGLVMDSQGRLVLCQHGDRRVARLESRRLVQDSCRQLPGEEAQQPERRRLSLGRLALLHRPALRPARQERRPQEGTAVQRRLPALAQRGADPAHQGDDLPQRHRPLARREDALRGQFRPREGDLDGLPAQGRRHPRHRPGLLRRHPRGRRRSRASPTA